MSKSTWFRLGLAVLLAIVLIAAYVTVTDDASSPSSTPSASQGIRLN